MKTERFPRSSAALFLLLMLAGLVLVADPSWAKKKGKGKEAEFTGPVFYPEPPADPRIQWLASYSTEIDVKGRTGRFKRLLFGTEEKSLPIVKPYGVALHDGKLFAVDGRGMRVAVYDIPGKSADYIGDRSPGRLAHPTNIAIDTDGTRYISDNKHDRVMVYGTDNRYLRALGDPETMKPVDVLIRGDLLYVCDIDARQVVVMNKESGEILRRFPSKDDIEASLLFPTNLAADSEGNIYVTDTGHFRVLKFSPEGKMLKQFGQLGRVPGTFTRPKGIALDREDRLYVVDAAFDNVQIFNKEGKLLLFYGGSGTAPGSMNLPAQVAIDYDHVGLFRDKVAPGHDLQCLILVTSQYGRHKVNVYGLLKFED